MQILGIRNSNFNKSKYLLFILCCIIYSCNSNEKKKIETKIKVDKKIERTINEQVNNEREKLNLKPIKSKGMSVVLLGDGFKFYDKNQTESDSTPKHGEIFKILEISNDKYPKGDNYHCEQYPYIHLSNPRINGWISGKYVYRINDEPEKTIEISNETFSIYKSEDFGIGSIDSTGNFTGCLEYFPILLKSVNNDSYHIINLQGENPIYNNVQCLIFYDADELIDITSESTFTVFKIKTEGMEGGYYYDLTLRKEENHFITGEISNVKEWTF